MDLPDPFITADEMSSERRLESHCSTLELLEFLSEFNIFRVHDNVE
jgi:hypothetical protein